MSRVISQQLVGVNWTLRKKRHGAAYETVPVYSFRAGNQQPPQLSSGRRRTGTRSAIEKPIARTWGR